MTTINVEVDTYADIDSDGKMLFEVYLSDADDPAISVDYNLGDIIDHFIEMNSIPGGSVRPEHRAHLLEALDNLEEIINKKRYIVANLTEV